MLNDAQLGAAESYFAFDSSTHIPVPSGGPTGTITIPDAHLLFTATFKRAGYDLKLIGDDGASVVVRDYFLSDKRATLLSPEGAALYGDIVEALAGPANPGKYAQATAPQAAAQAIGKVAKVEGSATVLRNGVVVTLNSGDAVLKGDVVQTGGGSSVGITFLDGSTISLTANARMVLNEFVYDPSGSANSQVVNLVQGSLSFISGQVAKTGDMKIGTPAATMGIRGTAGQSTIINATDGTASFSIWNQGDGTTHRAVIIDNATGNIIGTATSDGGIITVRPVGPLQFVAQETGKNPEVLAAELAALSVILNTQAIGQQILNINPPDNPTTPQPKSLDKSGSSEPLQFEIKGPSGETITGNINFNPPQDNPRIGNDNTLIEIVGIRGLPKDFDPIHLDLPDPDSFNTIFGTDGDDVLIGTPGNDIVLAGPGDDIVIAGHGGGDDIYDGGAGFDIVKYESTTLGIVADLGIGTEFGGTVFGPEIGFDVLKDIEAIVGGSGDDIFRLHGDFRWSMDGGPGIDIIRLVGGFDIRDGDGDDGPEANNIEIIDLNENAANTVDIDVEGIVQLNSAGTIRVLGGTSDHVNVLNDSPNFQNGHWEFVGSALDSFADSLTDGITFNEFRFVSGEQILATVFMQQGLNADFIENVTVNVVTDDGYDLSPGTLYYDMANSEVIAGYDSTHLFAENASKDIKFELIGHDLTYDDADFPEHFQIVGGRITELKIYDLCGCVLVTATGFDFDAAQFNLALNAFQDSGFQDTSGLDAIFQNVSYDFTGGGGSDVLVGGAFRDKLNGAGGGDELTGGDGPDTFIVHGAGATTITDFSIAGGDRIDVAPYENLHHMTDIGPLAHQAGADTVIDFGNGDVVTLQNVVLNNLSDDDFIFKQDTGNPDNYAPVIEVSEHQNLTEAGDEPGVDTSLATVTVSDEEGDLIQYALGEGWMLTAPDIAGGVGPNGHFYTFISFDQGTVSWSQAQSAAAEMGGYFATITSADENDFIFNSIVGDNVEDGATAAYIGATDSATEGLWYWASGPEGIASFWNNGPTGQYSNWREGEPNNVDEVEHFAVMEGDGTWNDAADAYANAVGYVVEFSTYQMAGTYGYAEFDTATGKMIYHLDNNDSDTEALGPNDHVTDSFEIAATDGIATTMETVSFTIDGANDAPEIKGAASETHDVFPPVGDQSGFGLADNFSFKDPDAQDTHEVSVSFNAQASQNLPESFDWHTVGSFTAELLNDSTVSSDGLVHWEFDVAPGDQLTEFNELPDDSSLVFDVNVTDFAGAVATHQVVVHVFVN